VLYTTKLLITITLTVLSPVHTGDYSRRKRLQFVTEFGDSRRKRR